MVDVPKSQTKSNPKQTKPNQTQTQTKPNQTKHSLLIMIFCKTTCTQLYTTVICDIFTEQY